MGGNEVRGTVAEKKGAGYGVSALFPLRNKPETLFFSVFPHGKKQETLFPAYFGGEYGNMLWIFGIFRAELCQKRRFFFAGGMIGAGIRCFFFVPV